MSKRVVDLEIYEARGSLGVSLYRTEDGSGDGYRIFGPKHLGSSRALKTVILDVNEIDRLIAQLKESKKFLIKKAKP
jgi:hypothetical protein